MLVLPVLLYACETWIILAADERRLEAFHMKCQRQITKIRWQDHIRNSEVTARTGLGPVSDLITLRCHVDLTLGQSWKRRPGRPNNRWIDRLQDRRPHGQKATATQLRVYFPAHKYQLTRSLFFHGLHTHAHHTCSYRAQERKQKTMLCFTSIWYCY